jgi:plasmid stabilization system protein ParE
VRWYNERMAGLGDDFRTELATGIQRIAEGPLMWPMSSYDQRARRYLLSRFPYAIVYVLRQEGDVVVAAVAHAKRQPGYWLKRIG